MCTFICSVCILQVKSNSCQINLFCLTFFFHLTSLTILVANKQFTMLMFKYHYSLHQHVPFRNFTKLNQKKVMTLTTSMSFLTSFNTSLLHQYHPESWRFIFIHCAVCLSLILQLKFYCWCIHKHIILLSICFATNGLKLTSFIWMYMIHGAMTRSLKSTSSAVGASLIRNVLTAHTSLLEQFPGCTIHNGTVQLPLRRWLRVGDWQGWWSYMVAGCKVELEKVFENIIGCLFHGRPTKICVLHRG